MATAQVTPVFLDSAPPDEVAESCLNKIDAAVGLRALVRTSAAQIDTVVVTATDSLSATNAACTGGTLFRIWTARDFDGDSVRQVQEITFEAPPVDDGPVIDPVGLPALADTVDCSAVNFPSDPDSYVRWLSDRRIAISLAARPGCAPIVSIDDDAPDALDGFDCDDLLEVTFTVTDLCGAMDMVVFSYATVDTLAPVISGVVSDPSPSRRKPPRYWMAPAGSTSTTSSVTIPLPMPAGT